MAGVFELLKQDHREVEQLFDEFERSGDRDVALRICDELSIHATVEEELIYPLFRANVAIEEADHAREEHAEAKGLIADIYAAGSSDDDVKAAVAQLKDVIGHHVEEEENNLFPKMAEALPETVAMLGNDVETRKEQLREANKHVHGSVADKPVPSGDPARSRV